MATNNLILQLSNARKNILDILYYHQDYDISSYKNFSISEIDAMYTNEQLDMLCQKAGGGNKTYVKFYVNKTLRANMIDSIVTNLYEDVLKKNDTLIIIVLDEPNESICTYLNHIWKNKGIFIVIHNIKRLQYNILEHDLVPHMTILNDEEVNKLKIDMNLTSVKQLPEIGRFDPQSLAMSVRPGNVCKITRKSVTSLENDYYRICV
jgi:DNA-directed RNA polymerase subunit H (RpoH/RPB5)